MAENDRQLTIGALAEAVGVGVETIRYYQRRGLVHEPQRAYGRIRRYGLNDMARLNFIRSAKELGFSLDEIAELLQLDDGTDCEEARSLAEQKLVDIRQKIAELRRIERVLSELVRECQRKKGPIHCPLIMSLRERSAESEIDE
ncbi:MAG: Hg(II)-responsive transcriptional regulator [Wenzhouxiangella sp.]